MYTVLGINMAVFDKMYLNYPPSPHLHKHVLPLIFSRYPHPIYMEFNFISRKQKIKLKWEKAK